MQTDHVKEMKKGIFPISLYLRCKCVLKIDSAKNYPILGSNLSKISLGPSRASNFILPRNEISRKQLHRVQYV